jgi:ubiquitin C-terminal hydrolase
VSILLTHPPLCQAYSYVKKDIVNHCLFFENPRRKIETIEITKDFLTSEKQPSFFEDYVTCKTEGNRQLAMQVVTLLFKANPDDSLFIEALLTSIMDNLPAKMRKPSTKDSMVGLYNMGCICYINAMLQMLNSIEPFRNGIMMIEVDNDKKIINELQRMMSYLYFS